MTLNKAAVQPQCFRYLLPFNTQFSLGFHPINIEFHPICKQCLWSHIPARGPSITSHHFMVRSICSHHNQRRQPRAIGYTSSVRAEQHMSK